MRAEYRAQYRALLTKILLLPHDPEQPDLPAQLAEKAGAPVAWDWTNLAEWARHELARLDQEEET